jgi:hypothetical protein
MFCTAISERKKTNTVHFLQICADELGWHTDTTARVTPIQQLQD